MYFYIDSNDNYKLRAETTEILHVPEFRTIAEDSKYGWNFVYYIYLFCSRVPFGYMTDEDKDSKISEVIENYPFRHLENRKVNGFFKTPKFKKAAEVFGKMKSDSIYDTWLNDQKTIQKINELKAKLNLTVNADLGMLGVYTELIKNLINNSDKLEEKMKEQSKSFGSKNAGLGDLRDKG